MNTPDEIFKKSETRQCKMVFPGTLNANGTLFGGEIMKWMDEVAFIAATRTTRQRMFTVKVENIQFISPVPENSIIEIVGNVIRDGPVKLEVQVQLFAESLHDPKRSIAAKAMFVMTALNHNNKVTRLSFASVEESSANYL